MEPQDGSPRPKPKIRIYAGKRPASAPKRPTVRVSAELPILTGKNSARRLARILAVQVLYAMEIHPTQDAGELITDTAKAVNLRHKGSIQFARDLVQGVGAQGAALDAVIIPRLEGWEFDRVSPANKAILRLALYEIQHRPDIPDRVTLDEAIDLAKLFSDKDDFKFVNALLDRFRKDFRK